MEKDDFEEVYQIISEASLLFNIDNEDFCYTKSDGKTKKLENIEEIIKLKSKINLQHKKEKKKLKIKKKRKMK